MRYRDGHHRQDHGGEAVGQLADSGAAAMSRPFGRKPYGARRRRRVSRPVPAGRRYPPSRCADGRACKDRAWPALRAGILSPRKITVKGAPSGRVSNGAPRHP
jgi:hypothetical protein